MSDAPLLETDRLVPYLEANLPGFRGPATVRKFSTGQSNPTFLIQASSGRYVLRRKPPGVLLKSAHAVEREYRVMRALAGSRVPVPQTHLLCEDPDVVGTPFFVMDYLDGRIFWDPALPDIAPADRTAYFEEIVRVLAELARLSPETVGLGDYGRPGNYVARQIARWTEQYRASETGTVAEMEALIGALTRSPPLDGGVALAHGDFRIDNLVFHADRPRIIGVLDWELSTLGASLVDVSYFCTMLRLPRDGMVRGLGDMDRRAAGLPAEAQILEAFLTQSGLSVPADWRSWIAFHAFRFAAIIQGVKKRHLDGNASSPDAAKVGAMVDRVARLGLEALEK